VGEHLLVLESFSSLVRVSNTLRRVATCACRFLETAICHPDFQSQHIYSELLLIQTTPYMYMVNPTLAILFNPFCTPAVLSQQSTSSSL
jgi:hypothetical protein